MATALLAVAGLSAVAGSGAVPGHANAAAGAVRISPSLRQVGAASAILPSTALCLQVLHIRCYGATQIERAYDLPALYARGITGRGETIVIVDAYGSPTLARDLKVFDKAFHLAAPPSLRIISPVGKIPAYTPTGDRMGWAGETTLDVEYAHAIAPGAKILVVETPSTETEGANGFPEIVAAENYVINHHLGQVISQSFGATEETFTSPKALLRLRSAYTNAAKHHVTVLAASGDDGSANYRKDGKSFYLKPTVGWPASDPLVTAIGGTTLSLDATGARTTPDVAWNDTPIAAVQGWFGRRGHINPFATGGGVSAVFPRPSYQTSVAAVVGARRGVPDISMSASCSGAVNTYQSFPGIRAGWSQNCGTSEATPLFAGIVALADQLAGHALGPINPTLYALAAAGAPGIVDATQGYNGVQLTQGGATRTVSGFTSVAGYDLATGLGTVDGNLFVPELAGRP